jgi:hypothetical protein
MRITGLALLAASALLAGALPVAAQGIDVHGEIGYLSLSAKDSATAVFDSSGGLTFGGGLGYRFRSGLYVEAGVRTFSKTGERVFVASPGSPVYPLGFPLEVKITPVYGTIGWRFLPHSLVKPYLGAGGGMASYSEESTVAGEVTQTSESKAEWHGVLGVEVGRGRFRIAAEGVYSTIPDAVGLSGVSKVYGETDAGGFTLLGRLTFTTSKR